jgi:hypothetical protein
MTRTWSVRVGLVAWFVMIPALALAQTGSGIIAGVVRDATGAVLPGVTVEARSPALIEKVRAVVTDGEGQYKIVELRPGTYTVTFALAGFSTVRRQGIELTTGFTAAVNADLRVGDVSETITVSAAERNRDLRALVPLGEKVYSPGYAFLRLPRPRWAFCSFGPCPLIKARFPRNQAA